LSTYGFILPVPNGSKSVNASKYDDEQAEFADVFWG
jgi:hypothetical protein